MHLYFGLDINDLKEFCQLVDKKENGKYEVNDKVFIDITDGIFVRTFIAEITYFAEPFAIIGFDDKFQALKPLSLITLKSFKDCNKEIRVKLFNSAFGVYIRDNYKYTLHNNNLTKSENDKQTYYFTLTKEEYDSFVYKNGDTRAIKTAIWNNYRTDFTLRYVPIEPVITVSTSSDLLTFRILEFDSRNFLTDKNLHNAYEKVIYYGNICHKNVEFFTDLNDCIRFTKSKKEEPRITNKLEKQWSWDCKPLNMSKKETKMTKIKDIKLNGPATILFTTDNKKVVVKCRPGDDYDPEKGILMVLCKYIHNSNKWTEIFDIPYKDEIDVEKVIAMSIVKDYFYKNDKDWHYNYVLKYMYNAVNLKTEDRVKALKALDYSVERIARCLGITKGEVKDILETKNKTVWETAKENLLSYLDDLKKVTNSVNKIPDNKPCNMEEKDTITDQNIIDLFNKGYSINKISKELGLTEYFVKKYLDAYTNPKTEKKAARILKKAVKNSKKEKKPRGGYHKRLTEIAFPSYLTKEESEDILERTKVKYEGKYKCMSELQKYFDRECKHFAINKFYGNGYSAFELGQMLGVSAAAIMRMRNNPI